MKTQIANLLIKTSTTEDELREMAIHRLLMNDGESSGIFLAYCDEIENNDWDEKIDGDFSAYLECVYRSQGTYWDSTWDEVEMNILNNIYANMDYLD